MANKKQKYEASYAFPFCNFCCSPHGDRLHIVHCRPFPHLTRHSHLSFHLIRRHSNGKLLYVTIDMTSAVSCDGMLHGAGRCSTLS
jgi:hypothetical protein